MTLNDVLSLLILHFTRRFTVFFQDKQSIYQEIHATQQYGRRKRATLPVREEVRTVQRYVLLAFNGPYLLG